MAVDVPDILVGSTGIGFVPEPVLTASEESQLLFNSGLRMQNSTYQDSGSWCRLGNSHTGNGDGEQSLEEHRDSWRA